MKGTSLVVSIVLFVAVAVLYILHFTGNVNKTEQIVSQSKEGVADRINIAYVKTDSLILNYDLAQDLHDDFSKKQEAYTNEYSMKRTTFEKDAAVFQEKLNRGGFLTEQSAKREQDRLVERQQEIVKLDQELSAKLGDIQAANNNQLLDSVISNLEALNKLKGYDYILNAGGILIGDEANNLTLEVLTKMNETYNKTKQGK